MAYTAKDYSKLLGMEGFSETLLKNHFTLYQGYVTNTNKLADTLAQMLKDGKAGTPEYAELKRRFGWEFNGMRLHEYYFENLGGKGAFDKGGKLAKKIAEDFGSYEEWEKDFKGVGTMRGIGWAILYQDSASGKFFNCWINEHDGGHLAGCASDSDPRCLRTRLHGRLRPEKTRLYRLVLQEHRLEGSRGTAEVVYF